MKLLMESACARTSTTAAMSTVPTIASEMCSLFREAEAAGMVVRVHCRLLACFFVLTLERQCPIVFFQLRSFIGFRASSYPRGFVMRWRWRLHVATLGAVCLAAC